MKERLEAYGWNERWKRKFDELLEGRTTAAVPLEPARVAAQHGHLYRVVVKGGNLSGEVSGRFAFDAAGPGDFPAVGDWVAVSRLAGEDKVVIHAVLPRVSAFRRKAAGPEAKEQLIAANVDTLWIVMALNDDFNMSKLERYLIAAWESGAAPEVVLTKADLCEDPERRAASVIAAAPGVPVHVVSAPLGLGREELAAALRPERTLAVTGSSGVGKSTILNWLAGMDLQRTHEIRESDDRGKHTTTHRELFALPGGALLIDTPGMRELALWDAGDGWRETFADIEELAADCRFRDCRHMSEAGCAVLAAVAAGELDARRLGNYRKTGRELAYQERKEQSARGKLLTKSRQAKASHAADRRAGRKAAVAEEE